MIRSGLLVIAVLLTSFTTTLAQSSKNILAWTTAKDVQEVANKKLFNDDKLRKSHIHVSSVSPTLNVSKDVHRKQDAEVQAKGNVPSKYPNWIISKGVHQRKK